MFYSVYEKCLFDTRTRSISDEYYDGHDIYNKPIYAFAYKEDERALNFICKPVKGMILKDDYFYEFKKNGKDIKKNGVSIYSRFFADTYEEAKYGFNWLVLNRIKNLNNEINKLKNLLI